MKMEQHLDTFVQLAQQHGLLSQPTHAQNDVHSMAWRLVEAERQQAKSTEQDARIQACTAYASLLSDEALAGQV